MVRRAKTTTLVEAITEATTSVVSTQLTDCTKNINTTQLIEVTGDGNTVSGNVVKMAVESVSNCQGSAENSSQMADTIMAQAESKLTETQKGVFAGLTSGSTDAKTLIKNEISRVVTTQNIVSCVQNSASLQAIKVQGSNNAVNQNQLEMGLKSVSECIAKQLGSSAVLSEISSKLKQEVDKKVDASIFPDLGGLFGPIGIGIVAVVLLIVIIVVATRSSSPSGFPMGMPMMGMRPRY